MGSEEEKRQLKAQYKNEVDFQNHLKQERQKEENRRDTLETKRCDDLFMKKCQEE